jgi:asparagine synthase (glutamine-hydrolysing)
MCGIAGIFSQKKQRNILSEIATKMALAVSYRGPDDSGVWVDNNENIALSHRRLSIIDISNNGHQPMKSGCERYVLVFNGEIYNYIQLRKELEEVSFQRWKGNSDTEVLIQCISEWGLKATLKKCRGMFALGLWDHKEKKLCLARDRFGEKPLYYGDIGKDFVFGSELKALQAHPDFNNSLNREALANFLRFSYVPSPSSIFNGIFKLPPANILSIDFPSGTKRLSSYWSLEEPSYLATQVEEAGILNELHEKLSKSVSEQMIADVQVGAFLSGGIDSSLIVALMQKNSMNTVKTFSIGFSDKEYDESHYAQKVSKILGTDHYELILSPDELLKVVPRIKTIYDEPFADSSQVPTFLVSKLAVNEVSVCLSGDGGDEVFGGYNRYRWTNDVWSRMITLPLWLRKLISKIIFIPSEYRWKQIYSLVEFLLPLKYKMRLPGEKIHKVAVSLAALDVEDLYLCLTSLWKEADNIVLGAKNDVAKYPHINARSLAEKMMFLDLGIYLPGDILTKVDRAAMSVSLETRVPFLNHNLVEFAWNMPLHMKIKNGESKWALRQLLLRYLPIELINRPKMGFGVPIDSWLRGPLKSWAKELIDEELIRNDGYFKYEKVLMIWNEHQSGKFNHHHKLWNILMFQSWLHD